jgi:hypothetical protein
MATAVDDALSALGRIGGLGGGKKSSVICRALADGMAGSAAARGALTELVRLHESVPASAWVKPALFIAERLRSAAALADVAWALELLPGMLLDQPDLFCEFVGVVFEEAEGAAPQWPSAEVLAATLGLLASVATMQNERPVQMTGESLRNLRRRVLTCPGIDASVVFHLLALFVASQEPVLFALVRDMLRGCLKLPLTERKTAFLATARECTTRAVLSFGDLSRWCLNHYETLGTKVQLHDAWLLLTMFVAWPLDASRRQRVHALLRSAAEGEVEEWCAHPSILPLAAPLSDLLLATLSAPGSSWWCIPALVELAGKRPDILSAIVTAALSRVAQPELAPKCLQLIARLPQSKCAGLVANYFAAACSRLTDASVIGTFYESVAPLLLASADSGLLFFKTMQRDMSSSKPEPVRLASARGLAIITCSAAIQTYPAFAVEPLIANQEPAVKRAFYLQLSKMASMILAFGDTDDDAVVGFVRAPAVEQLFAQMAKACAKFVANDAIWLCGDLAADVGALTCATAMLHQLRERLGIADRATRYVKSFGKALSASMQSLGHGVEDANSDQESAIVAGICVDVLASTTQRQLSERDRGIMDMLFTRIGTLPMESSCVGSNGLIALLAWMGRGENAAAANLRCLGELVRCSLSQAQLCAVLTHCVTVLGRVSRAEFDQVQAVRIVMLELLLKVLQDTDARFVSISQGQESASTLDGAGNFIIRLCRETYELVGCDLLLFLCQRLRHELPPKNASMPLLWAYLRVLRVSSAPRGEASAVLQEVLSTVHIAERKAVAELVRLALTLTPPTERVNAAVAMLQLALHNNREGVSEDYLPLAKPGTTVPGKVREPSVVLSPMLAPIVCEALATIAADKSRIDCERERTILAVCTAIAHLKPSKKVWRQLLVTARDLLNRFEAFVAAEMEGELVELAVLSVQLAQSVEKNAEIPVPQSTFLAFRRAVEQSEEPRLVLALSGEVTLMVDDAEAHLSELDCDDLADSDGRESSDSGEDLENFIRRR